MEVHAHTHTSDPDNHRGRKKWTHYFWEFFMLFLAVFSGFLAEFKLEQTIERHREKEYIHSMIEDLEQDTLILNSLSKFFAEKGKDLDSLMILLNTPNIKEKGASIYLKGRMAPYMRYFAMTDRTILQMKNSGGFRLIRNRVASKSILDYYAGINFLEQIQSINRQQAETYRNIAIDVFDPLVFESMITDKTNIVTQPGGNPMLLTYDEKQLTRLTGSIHFFNSSRRTLDMSCKKQKQEAGILISILKKEYQLE